MEVDEEDRDRMAFMLHHGLYAFNSMPAGLENAAGTFKGVTDFIIATVKRPFTFLHPEDITIFLNSLLDHVGHECQELQRLPDAGGNLKLKNFSNF